MPKPQPILVPTAISSRRVDLFAAIGLLVIALPWWIATTCPFIDMDDSLYVVGNPHVLSGLSLANMRWAFANVEANLYQPLTWLSLMCDATLFGSGPVGFHVTNVFLHVINMLLVYAFLRTTTRQAGRSFIVAALFGIHPLRVESVAWVTERKDVLAIFFGLWALLAYARYARTCRWTWYGAMLLLATLSLLAKATLVTLPALLLLLDIWPLDRWSQATGHRRRLLLLEKIPLIALSVASLVATRYALNTEHAVVDFSVYPLNARLGNALISYASYLRDTIYPVDLSVFYPLVENPPWDLAILSAAAVLLLGGLALWRSRSGRSPAVTIGYLWFLGTLVPMLGLVQSGAQGRADRFTYFPSIGLFIAWVWCWPAGWFAGPARSRIGGLVTACLLLVLGWFTTLRLNLWRDPLALYLDGMALTDRNWYLTTRAGDALRKAGALGHA